MICEFLLANLPNSCVVLCWSVSVAFDNSAHISTQLHTQIHQIKNMSFWKNPRQKFLEQFSIYMSHYLLKRIAIHQHHIASPKSEKNMVNSRKFKDVQTYGKPILVISKTQSQ